MYNLSPYQILSDTIYLRLSQVLTNNWQHIPWQLNIISHLATESLALDNYFQFLDHISLYN